jgi:hypothetical protein
MIWKLRVSSIKNLFALMCNMVKVIHSACRIHLQSATTAWCNRFHDFLDCHNSATILINQCRLYLTLQWCFTPAKSLKSRSTETKEVNMQQQKKRDFNSHSTHLLSIRPFSNHPIYDGPSSYYSFCKCPG